MKNSLLLSIVVLFCISSFVRAEFFTMDFNDPYEDLQDAYGQGEQYIQGDYFISTTNTPGHDGAIIRFNPFNQYALVPNNGTIHMGVTAFANPWLQRVDGTPFSVISLDIAEYSEYFSSASIPIVGIREDGAQISMIMGIDGVFDGFGGIDDFQTYVLNWTDIVRLEFGEDGFSFDNVVLIPEPATLLLVGMGAVLIRKRVN